VPEGDIARGLYPQPPDLANAATLYSPAELFWIVKNSIKMTGMPSWRDHSDEELWAKRCVSQETVRHWRARICLARDSEHCPWRPPLSNSDDQANPPDIHTKP